MQNELSAQIAEIIFIAGKVAEFLRGRNVCIFTKNKMKRYFLNEYLSVFPKTPAVLVLFELMEEDAFWFNLEEDFLFLDILKLAMGWNDLLILTEPEIKKVFGLLTRLIDGKDISTRMHSERVALIALKIGEELKIPAETLKIIEIAGLLHDIGKVAIPAKILNKPGKLSENEFLLVKSHPFYTYKLFEMVRGLEEAAKWAGYHHEKLDGSGYPFKIKKEGLDLEARIIQVADITAALTEDRSYRNSLKKEQVVSILRSESRNNKIDSDIAELTIKLLLEGRI
ncbi:HD-GYP domain-containing protein [Carboxydothermus ferrireducens]|uniref:HD-GYP domain-containing protein n=1 Tax=Carboxydothermus ferrireducens TaxID=54265 RepID=UPI0015C9B923|nr:HD domain-containing phosphohydrolase [Carboxydothermus ferrireducens]